MGEVHADDVETSWEAVSATRGLNESTINGGYTLSQHIDFLDRIRLRPYNWFRLAVLYAQELRGESIATVPMVQMMEVRRKFLAGTMSIRSFECHCNFSWLLR